MNPKQAKDTQDNLDLFVQADVPQELFFLILGKLNSIQEVLRLQTINKATQKALWRSITRFGTKFFRESAQQEAKSLINRLDPKVLKKLALTGYDISVEEVRGLLQRFVALRKISIKSFIDPLAPNQLITDISHHKTLEEVKLAGIWPGKIDFIHRILPYVRVLDLKQDHEAKPFDIRLDHANYHSFATRHCLFNMKESIQMDSQLLRGCCVGAKIILGFDDGTLSFYYFNERDIKLKHMMTSTLHGGPITHIWCDPLTEVHPAKERADIVVASADRTVSHWRNNGSTIDFQKRILFPEPINCVFYSYKDDALLAASEHSVYYCLGDQIANIKDGFEGEITGIFHSNFCYYISTKTGCYSAFGDHPLADLNCFGSRLPNPQPNMSFSPAGSLKAVVTRSRVQVMAAAQPNRYLIAENGNFDENVCLQAFSPSEYWFAMSTGPSIAIFNIDVQIEIARFAPHIPKKEMVAGNFPRCRTFWFDQSGNNLFAVFSDNKLYLWNIQKGPESIEVKMKNTA